ncbi:MAG: L-seryl-tRNA(Sec) selenium transferase, partial [Ilumatobacteraceae bacterium]
MVTPRPPSVDALARGMATSGLPHAVCVELARRAIADGPESFELSAAVTRAQVFARSLLAPVINATGVLLHTNLGRAPLEVVHPPTAMNIEFDLQTGERGSRQHAVGALLAMLCGAEAAIVVNNNASAVLLVLAAIARDRQVVVSRGESVEIGGGFRIPDVIEQSGA